MKKIFGQWYNLPEDLQTALKAISPEFFNLKDCGAWAPGRAERYEPDAIVVMRTAGALSYDYTMPRLKKIMEAGVDIAIFPSGMRLDIVFYTHPKKTPEGVKDALLKDPRVMGKIVEECGKAMERAYPEGIDVKHTR